MKVACLIDWIDGEYAIPWMQYKSIEDAKSDRKTAHSSWPTRICEIETDDKKIVRSRRAELSGRNDPYFNEKSDAYRIASPVKNYWD